MDIGIDDNQYLRTSLLLLVSGWKVVQLRFPIGCESKIYSILKSTSLVNLGNTYSAFTVSTSCSGLVAPVMAVEISGLTMHHAIASWACEHPS